MVGLSSQPPCYWNVSTLAGSGSAAYADGTGAGASFQGPEGVAFRSSSGNGASLVVADSGGSRLRLLNTYTGVTTTLAGNGIAAVSAGTPATAHSIDWPQDAVELGGVVYAPAGHATHIMAIVPGGAMSILYSTLPNAATGVTTNGVALFLAECGSNKVSSLTTGGVYSALAGSGAAGFLDATGAAALFSCPTGIRFFSGLLYVTDKNNNRIRRVSTTAVVTTLAGSGAAGTTDGPGLAALLNGPWALHVDAQGAVLFTEQGGSSSAVRVLRSGYVSTLAGSGAAQAYADGFGTSARFNSPIGLAVRAADDAIFVGDYVNLRIRQLTCVPCPASYHCFSGSPVLCPAGSFCPLGSQNASLCPPGTFSSAGAASCTPCPAGTLAPAPGTRQCQKCPGGHFCPAGTSSWASLSCGRGQYCPDGSGAPTPCPLQVPLGGWGDLQVQGPAFVMDTAQCLNHCYWNFTSGSGALSKC